MGSLLATFSAALEARDPYLRGHAARVTALSEGLARTLGWTKRRLDALRLGASLHDVGKITMDTAILRKPGPLDERELAQIRAHPHRPALSVDQALAELERCAGTQFDPSLARTFVDGWRRGAIAA